MSSLCGSAQFYCCLSSVKLQFNESLRWSLQDKFLPTLVKVQWVCLWLFILCSAAKTKPTKSPVFPNDKHFLHCLGIRHHRFPTYLFYSPIAVWCKRYSCYLNSCRCLKIFQYIFIPTFWSRFLEWQVSDLYEVSFTRRGACFYFLSRLIYLFLVCIIFIFIFFLALQMTMRDCYFTSGFFDLLKK